MQNLLTHVLRTFKRIQPQLGRWLILAMLLSLHGALVSSHEAFERTWLMIHFGLFLLWQPFISPDRELNTFSTLLLVCLTGVVLYTLSGWMLVMWIAILIAIMGGKVFTLQVAARGWFYLVAVFYLFAILLAWSVPVSLLELKALPSGVSALVTLFLPFVLLTLLVLPFHSADETRSQVFDFFYSLFVFQLVVVLVLGSIAAMRITGNQYFQAVVLTVLCFAGALLLLALLWGPRTGFGGLRTYFSRYLMTVGMPFELWMRRIAALSEVEMSPARFLDSAMIEIASMPWIAGGNWQTADSSRRFGKETNHTAHFNYQTLNVVFYTRIRLSPALLLHLRLLAQVVGEFYEGKRREQELKQNAYMQAVHETGARLTHDIKNLLQSLYTLTAAGAAELRAEPPRETSPYAAMLERQLPHLTKRLQTTLDKLQNPTLAATRLMLPLKDWWQDICQRHAGSDIRLTATGDMQPLIPTTLFDTVLENCLENARRKKMREPNLQITVELAGGDRHTLIITDTGSSIPAEVADRLLHAPITHDRQGSLGIGLFQANRQAIQAGYLFALTANQAGKVQFTLRPARGQP